MDERLKATLREIAEFHPPDMCDINPCEQCQELITRREMATQLLERFDVETGWLLDDGRLCLGSSCRGRLNFVAYTDPNAIRFARKWDAEGMLAILKSEGLPYLENVKPVEHSWG